MRFQMSVGDPSGDGHSQCDYFIIETNADNIDAVNSAYNKAVKKTKLDLVASVCESYEENTISKANVKILAKHGINIEDYCCDLDFMKEGDDYAPANDLWPILVCDFIRIGNPALTFKVLEEDQFPKFDGGGYGLFF